MTLRRTDTGWSEQAPPDCENCDLAWPFDGTAGRVYVGHSHCRCNPGGHRTYECAGCGHITLVPRERDERCRAGIGIGAGPDSPLP